MTQLDDQRILFYLENQELIDTWASLIGETRSALSEWLLDLSADIEELAMDLGADYHLRNPDRWKIHMLAKPSWNPQLNDDAATTVALEWNASDVRIPTKLPYVGLRVLATSEEDQATRDALLRRCKEVLKGYRFGNSRTSWLAWRYVRPPTDRWWEHTDEYAATLLDATRAVWADVAPFVDQEQSHRRARH